MAEDSNQVALATGLHLQDAEPVFLVVKGGALDEAGQDLGRGAWVPGIFGRNATVDKAYTTLYASDRDMFVFLADEDRRIEIPNRRDGKPGSLTRGFFVWNSELGNTTLGGGFFLFDYVCSNRYVWDTDRTPRSASAIRVGHPITGSKR